ncbi:helix-turn-helix domain-containing protein [Streptomyces muensis]|uniref:TetR/AcrR family transcriptional regulator n=1 Tax=Streptomyces muensis TaxID=1077944 RepID=A0A9X1Q1Q3_STRM4|nr:helix-turn-helix domain-containing protein [Streptomyces muensis]MCF1596956.1 TetR/AcrR family transcriptional regulator [Streptomyces muensis]
MRAAADLFADEGIHAIGVTALVERADVAKAASYSTFKSKNDLADGCPERQDNVTSGRFQRIEGVTRPYRSRSGRFFDLLSSTAVNPPAGVWVRDGLDGNTQAGSTGEAMGAYPPAGRAVHDPTQARESRLCRRDRGLRPDRDNLRRRADHSSIQPGSDAIERERTMALSIIDANAPDDRP